MGDTEVDFRQQLFTRKDELLDSINNLLETWGFDMELELYFTKSDTEAVRKSRVGISNRRQENCGAAIHR